MLKQIEDSINEFIAKGMGDIDEETLYFICEERAKELLQAEGKDVIFSNYTAVANIIASGVADRAIESEYQELKQKGVDHETL